MLDYLPGGQVCHYFNFFTTAANFYLSKSWPLKREVSYRSSRELTTKSVNGQRWCAAVHAEIRMSFPKHESWLKKLWSYFSFVLTEEAVNEVKRQAVSELQKAVAAAEQKANEMVSAERAKLDQSILEARQKAAEEAVSLLNQQEDSSEVKQRARGSHYKYETRSSKNESDTRFGLSLFWWLVTIAPRFVKFLTCLLYIINGSCLCSNKELHHSAEVMLEWN